MSLSMRWYHETKSRNFLKIILYFSIMFWIFRKAITISLDDWPWIAICFGIALTCMFSIYRASRTMRNREVGSFLFFLWAFKGIPLYIISDLKNHQYVSLILSLPCFVIALYRVLHIIFGHEHYVHRGLRPVLHNITVSEACLSTGGLFLILALMVNGGSEGIRYPIQINSSNSDYTLTFLTISGILALYPILVSLYNVVNNFSRRKRTKL